MASTYTAYDSTKPDQATQGGVAYGNSDKANQIALEGAAIAGASMGWSFAQYIGSGTAEQPQYLVWSKGVFRQRATLTWGASAGGTGNITAITWEVSQDSGSTPNATGTWASMGTAQAFTYDANGNLQTASNAGGFVQFLAYLLGKVKVLLSSFNTHTGAAINTVHSGGTMALQNANNVAVTGGYAELSYERNKTTALGSLNASQGIDWKAQGFVTVTVTGASATFTYTNLPPGGNGGMSGALMFKVVNGGLATNLFGSAKKPTGFTLSSAATDWVALACVDGTTPEVVGVTKAVA